MDMITLAMAKAYTDKQRLAYVKTEEAVIFSETTITEWEDLFNDGSIFFHRFSPPVKLKVGETYTVIWGGAKYECKCGELYGSPFLGNAIKFSGNENAEIGNNEPFMLWDFSNNPDPNKCFEVDTDNANPHTFAIYQEVETIHPIDPKFIPWDSAPGGGMPVVEIATPVGIQTDGYDVELTAEESAKLTEVARLGMPCIVKTKSFRGSANELIDATYPFYLQNDPNETDYVCMLHNGYVLFLYSEDLVSWHWFVADRG